MNFGAVFAWTGIVLSSGAAVGYAAIHDWRRALYFFFGACITAVVTWK